jgi:hypothetical protein
MKHIFRILFLLLGLLMMVPAVDAAPTKDQPRRKIPTFIESFRKQKNHLLNVGKYDKNALVYYVYHIDLSFGSSAFNKESFKDNTEFLSNAYKKIYHKGAELVMHLSYSDEDAARFERYKKSRYYDVVDIPRLAKQCSLKCPIVNSYKRKVRQAFFQDTTSEYSCERFRALDSNGNVLAYFSRMNDSIIMYDEEFNTRKVLKSGGFESDGWEAAAIVASYEELVSRMQRRELAAKARAKSEQRAKEEAGRKKKEARESKKKAQPKRKKPVRLDEDDFVDEDEEDTPEDEEDEEDEDVFDEDDDFLDEDEE